MNEQPHTNLVHSIRLLESAQMLPKIMPENYRLTRCFSTTPEEMTSVTGYIPPVTLTILRKYGPELAMPSLITVSY